LPVAESALLCEQQQPASDGILQACTDHRADMLVLIARQHSLLGSMFHRSVTAQVIERSRVPVLLLPSHN
jgi:nucleotide-binding universal stress UspA family protein